MNHQTSLKACPTELNSAINLEFAGRSGGVESHRNLFCGRYDDCLDEAVKHGWSSFTCVHCPLFTPTPTTKRSRSGIDMYATQRRVA